jgi:hypothetical protein
MASPTTPTHGKQANLYRIRPNGFKGVGLNNLAWGAGFNGAASAYFEVVIDGTGAPDTFKWRKNGGSWTSTVAITGAAQTLSDGQTITFAAPTGHTATDQWVIGNLKDEPTTESGVDAQITDTTRRLLNPNAPPTWTDSGGKNAQIVDFTQAKATFNGNVGNVSATGNNGYLPAAALEQVGYLLGWDFSLELDLTDVSAAGDNWKTWLPGQAGGRGSAEAFFIGSKSALDALTAAAESDDWFLLQLFNYDPDQDQTGDRFTAWVKFDSLASAGRLNAVVNETVNFTIHGPLSFTANV